MLNLLILLLAATCRDRDGFLCDRSVETALDASSSHSVKLNVAVGDVVSVELPKDVKLHGEPALGNQALFDVKVVADPLRVLVWPKLPASAAELGPDALLGERSNLQLFLDAGLTISIELQIARSERAVQQVRFRFAKREEESQFIREKVEEETRRLESEYEEKRRRVEHEVADAARERLSRGMLEHVDCEPLRGRVMHDLVVVRAEQICRIGADLFIGFSIQNRSRRSFALDRVEVRQGESETAVPGARVVFEGEQVLSFDQTVRGVVAWPMDEELAETAEWSIVAIERGGPQRAIVLEGVGF